MLYHSLMLKNKVIKITMMISIKEYMEKTLNIENLLRLSVQNYINKIYL